MRICSDMRLFVLSFIPLTITGAEFTECGEPAPCANTYRTLYDTYVEYRCLDNYILTSGNLTRECVNGTFTGTPPVCIFSCGPPLQSGYANVTDNGRGSGAIATYNCSQDSLNTVTTTVCDENKGYWKEGDLCFDDVPLSMSTFSAVQSSTAVRDAVLNGTDVGSSSSPSPQDIDTFGADNAIDADTGTSLLSGSCSSTAAEHRPNINITMNSYYTIYMIVVIRPVDDFATSLPNIYIKSSNNLIHLYDCVEYGKAIQRGDNFTATCKMTRYPVWGKYIQIETDFGKETGMLQICNLEIYARPLSSVDCGQLFLAPYALAVNQPLDTHYDQATTKVYYSCTDGFTVKSGREYGYCNVNGHWTATLVCTAGENWSRAKNVWQITNTAEMLPSLTDFNTSTCLIVPSVKEATFVVDLVEDIEISDVSVTFNDVKKLNAPNINITVWRDNQAPVSCEPYRLVYYRGETGNPVCKFHPVGRYVSVHVFFDGDGPLEICELMVHGRQYKEALECYHYGGLTDYKGRMNMTVTGLPCQRWDSQSPHAHNDTDEDKFPDVSLSDAANYCRNPDGKYGVWCYTTDRDVPWQYCPVRHCDYMCLRDAKGSTYKGYFRKTSSGDDCVSWDSENIFFKKKSHFASYPNNNLNCRNPLLSQSGPWCYTSEDASSYGLCSIPTCPTSSDLTWGHWVMDVDQTLEDLLPSQECLVWNQLYLTGGNFSAVSDKAFKPRRYLNTFTAAQVCRADRVFNTTVLCYNMTDAGAVWKTGVLECVHCGSPPAVDDATVETTSKYLNGVSTYTCEAGFGHASGSDVIKCLRSGEWEIPDMVCHVDCGAPPSLVHADATFNSTLQGEATLYTCSDGHMYVSGSDQSTCLVNGSWTVPDFICEVHCGTLPSVNNTQASNTSGFLNASVVFTCLSGYAHVSGFDSITCLDTGEWQQPEIVCEVDCGPPPSVNNTDVMAGITTLNSTAIYTCGTSYVHVNGSTNITCTETGLWGVPTIKCLVSCGSPIQVPNATFTASGMWVASTGQYSCDDGFAQVSGLMEITCLENGTWEIPSIICEVDCGPPPSVNNTDVMAGNTTLSSTAIYTCDTSYVHVNGSTNITCTETGLWGLPTIQCLAVTSSSPSTTLQTTTSRTIMNVTDKYGRYRYESCICHCILPTRKQEDIISEISSKLILNTKELLSFKMRKESLPDTRKTSYGMAYLSISIIGFLFGVIFVSDLLSCYSGIRRYFQGKRKT